jgi:hypothetical protein
VKYANANSGADQAPHPTTKSNVGFWIQTDASRALEGAVDMFTGE